MVQVNEETTSYFQTTVRDKDSDPVPVASIDTATCDIYDQDSGYVFVSGYNIKPYITSSGTVDAPIPAAYNTIYDEEKLLETHVLHLVVSGVGGAWQIVDQYEFQVKNIGRR